MDPVSHGLVGAVLAESASTKRELGMASLAGFLSATLADLDILIRSSEDPLLVLDYHRQFTHSLIFIPVGAFVAAGILWLFLRRRQGFGKIYLYSILGYGTAGVMDAFTSYGTQLLWPFSDARIAWNIISIIDPLFTLPLAFFVVFAFVRKSLVVARVGLAFAVIYLLLGLYQREQAEDVLMTIAEKRGHEVERALVHPSFGNLILWRSVYGSGGKYYADAIRVGLFSEPRVYEGGPVDKFTPENDLHGLDPQSVLYRDVLRFNHFSDGYLVLYPGYPNVIGDLRYSLLPNGTKPIWGILADPDNPGRHVRMSDYDRAVTPSDWHAFLTMLRGWELNSGAAD
ncbi:MAG: metal-dependent hydrolase [Thermodesulfobacteriota bacterium]